MSRGHDRERAVKKILEAEGWFVMRAPASLGIVDLLALRVLDGRSEVRMIEVKSTAGGPWEHFRPEDRTRLRDLAAKTGAEAYLAWWPSRGKLKWYRSDEWP